MIVDGYDVSFLHRNEDIHCCMSSKTAGALF